MTRISALIILYLTVGTGTAHAQRNPAIKGAETSASYGFQSAIAAGIGFMDEAVYIHALFRFLLDAPLPISNGIGFIPQLGVGVGDYVSNGDKFNAFMCEAGGNFFVKEHYYFPVGLMYKTPVRYKSYFLSPGMKDTKYYDANTFLERMFLTVGFGYRFTKMYLEIRLLHNINNSIKEWDNESYRLIPHSGPNIGLEMNFGLAL
jgi:hypothetical protein